MVAGLVFAAFTAGSFAILMAGNDGWVKAGRIGAAADGLELWVHDLGARHVGAFFGARVQHARDGTVLCRGWVEFEERYDPGRISVRRDESGVPIDVLLVGERGRPAVWMRLNRL